MNRPSAFFLCLILKLTNSFCQSPSFQEYNLLNRNESAEIKCLYQGISGYLWIGTNKGLFRFDGVNKIRFTKSNGLPDDIVSAITQDSLGRIWTGHQGGEIAFQQGDKFIKFEPEEGSAGAEISKIHFTKKGTLWFSTLNDGIYYHLNNRLYRLDETDGMPDIFVYDFAEDKEGRIFAGTDLGIAVIELGPGKASIKSINSSNGLPDNIVTKVLLHSDTIWVATQDKGIFYLDNESNPVTINSNWTNGPVNDFLIDDNKIWFTSSEGLFTHTIKNHLTRKVQSDSRITSYSKVLQDREGNIWIGHSQGLVRSFSDYIQIINTTAESNVSNVVALVIDNNSNIWFSGNQGLYKRTSTSSGITVKKQLVNTPYENFPFISLFVDDRNNLWAGSYGMGVIKLDLNTNNLTHIKEQLNNGNVLSIRGNGNEVWLATLGGATQIINQNGKLTIKNFNKENGLLSDYNYQVFIDSKNRKWFATDGKWAMMLENGNFTSIVDSTRSKVFFGFDEDINGKIWANIQSDGIYQIENNQIRSINNFVPNEGISSFSCDELGNLVTLHDAGIDLINTTSGEVRRFGEEYGINSMKSNLNSVAKDKNGNIYFGTSNGIIVYSTKLNKYPNKPQAKVEFITNSNELVRLDGPMDFPYNQNDLVINYTAFWYQNPNELSFLYKLENFDNDWIMSRDRYATYSNLPPGEYTFKLKVSSIMDFQFQDETTLAFVINPPFWKRVWFYALIILLAIYAGYLYIRNRERNLVRENQLLELKVKERFAEILKKNEEIMAQAEEIKSINDNLEKIVKDRTEQLELKNKALEEAAFFNSHKLRAPVASLLGLTSLIKGLKLANEDRTYLEHFETSCQKLDEVIKNITAAIDDADHPDQGEVANR